MGKITNLSKDKFTIKANSTQTINFMGAEPNYYKIVNSGNGSLYVGVSMMPTEEFFDAKIHSASSKLIVDAYGHDEIYIYNPNSTNANIIVTSFYAEFDPSVLGMSDLAQDFSEVTMIGEFDATGDLKYNIEHIAGKLNPINNLLASHSTKFDNINNNVSKLESINNHVSRLETIDNNVQNINANTDSSLDIIIELLQSMQNPDSVSNTIQGYVNTIAIDGLGTNNAYPPEGRFFSKIISIIFDTENSAVSFNNCDGTSEISLSEPITLKNDLNMNVKCKNIYLCNDDNSQANAVIIAETKPYKTFIENLEIVSKDEDRLDLKNGDEIIDVIYEKDGQLYSHFDLYNSLQDYSPDEHLSVAYLYKDSSTAQQVISDSLPFKIDIVNPDSINYFCNASHIAYYPDAVSDAVVMYPKYFVVKRTTYIAW